MKLYQSLYDRLKNQHDAIDAIIQDMDERRVMAQLEPGKWSIHDNIAHLAKYQPVFQERINAILHLNNPIFNAYLAEYDPEFEAWRGWNTARLIERLNSDRHEIFEFITGLAEEELDRVGIHKKRGGLNVVQWTEFFVLHEAHHVRTIFQLAHIAETK